MNSEYIVKSKKIITVSEKKTIIDGAMVIKGYKIIDIGKSEYILEKYKELEVEDFGDLVICPSLIDCHTHLLEYAPSTVYEVTSETYDLGQKALILESLRSGVTTFGEQICGSPMTISEIKDFKEIAKNLPAKIAFSCNSITIGFEELASFTSITRNKNVNKDKLIDKNLLESLIENSDYPGENIFINATPANLTEDIVPRAGEIVYTQEELNDIVSIFHNRNKRIGCHVAGKEAIDMALKAGFDIIHHGHGITDEQIKNIGENNILLVATPLGGTHLRPNSPDEIYKLLNNKVLVAIATDAYLPPYKEVDWLEFKDNEPKGSPELMIISKPSMIKLIENGYNENEVLALITLNAAKVLGIDKSTGSLEIGKDADFIVSDGVPGIDVTDKNNIVKVYLRGRCLINK